jgi:DNA-binding response OmpR family regulator
LSRAGFERRTVVVIDDSPIALDFTRDALESAGFRVITRRRTEGTVNLVLQERPDLVLLDVNMPQVDGDITASLLRRAEPNSKTVIVLYSSLSSETLSLRAATAGAHGYIRKTGNVTELLRQVNGYLRASQSSDTNERLTESDGGEGSHGDSRVRIRVGQHLASASQQMRQQDSSGASLPPDQRTSGTLKLPSATVLFVDQDPTQLARYRSELNGDDLTPDFSTSTDRALARITSNTPPDVVVCDAELGSAHAAELFELAVQHDGSWTRRFVFVAGPQATASMIEFLRKIDGRVLYKPIDMGRLRQAIRYAAIGARVFGRAGGSGAR